MKNDNEAKPTSEETNGAIADFAAQIALTDGSRVVLSLRTAAVLAELIKELGSRVSDFNANGMHEPTVAAMLMYLDLFASKGSQNIARGTTSMNDEQIAACVATAEVIRKRAEEFANFPPETLHGLLEAMAAGQERRAAH